eukprot:CAMPEP_0184288784 /NCGR_PEP_ID=MMETSP1049-20130417/1265_1 /TAXON_ID=77928 /ORGANISM="Proteomonas sulcata, Strain CCMP704" /LENGTH=72 /DNA_ID=CAMNT_0026595321 /DNA_START=273 /DNA_END=491 /DNA_ORIENTATION=+
MTGALGPEVLLELLVLAQLSLAGEAQTIRGWGEGAERLEHNLEHLQQGHPGHSTRRKVSKTTQAKAEYQSMS